MSPPPRLLALVAVGGAAGAVIRYAATEIAHDGTGFPWTTFTINVVGSALLAGLVLLPVARRSPAWAAALGPGVLGGFTTFSAFSLDTLTIWERGEPVSAFIYVAVSVLVSLAAIVAGLSVARSFA